LTNAVILGDTLTKSECLSLDCTESSRLLKVMCVKCTALCCLISQVLCFRDLNDILTDEQSYMTYDYLFTFLGMSTWNNSLDEFSWNFICDDFSKICWENSGIL